MKIKNKFPLHVILIDLKNHSKRKPSEEGLAVISSTSRDELGTRKEGIMTKVKTGFLVRHMENCGGDKNVELRLHVSDTVAPFCKGIHFAV